MLRSFFMSSFILLIVLLAKGQSVDFLDFTRVTPYGDCAAVLYNGRILGPEYFIENKPKVGMGTGAVIGMATVSLSEKSSEVIKKIKFHVAIKNKRTNTTWIYTQEAVSELELDDIISKCEPGDRLIFMPIDQQYSLSHHEMWVAVGC